MRSIQSRNLNIAIQNALLSAQAIVRRDADRPSMFAMWCAATGFASWLGATLREALQHPTTVTRVGKTRVTGGVLYAVAMQRSERHSSPCRSAAR
jgi:hypothetical protein